MWSLILKYQSMGLRMTKAHPTIIPSEKINVINTSIFNKISIKNILPVSFHAGYSTNYMKQIDNQGFGITGDNTPPFSVDAVVSSIQSVITTSSDMLRAVLSNVSLNVYILPEAKD